MPKGRIVVTGASGSMGTAACRELARAGCEVVMACRNLEKAAGVREDILKECPGASLELRHVDLSSLASVRAFADGLKAEGVPISGLFNNAGTLNKDYVATEDGYEECVQVNCISPLLLCRLLAPEMEPGGHIVNMVSLSDGFARVRDDFFHRRPEDYSQLGSYAMSKRGLLLGTVSFALEHPDLMVNVSDPGIVDSDMITMHRWFDPLTDVIFRPFCNSPARGAAPALRALDASCTLRRFSGRSGPGKPIPPRFLSHPACEIIARELSSILEG